MNEDLKEQVEIKVENKIRKQSSNDSKDKLLLENSNSEKNGCHFRNNEVNNHDNSCASVSSSIRNSDADSFHNHSLLIGYLPKKKENCPYNSERKNDNNYSDQKYKNSSIKEIYNASSSEDDDEHCVYTYKGAEITTDLPESFIYLGVDAHNGREGNSACSSPEMDYLEMDFDPGPLNDQDSDTDCISASTYTLCCKRNENNNNMRDYSTFRNNSVEISNENTKCCSPAVINNEKSVSVVTFPSHSFQSTGISENFKSEDPCCSKSLNSERYISSVNKCDSSTEVRNNFNTDIFSDIPEKTFLEQIESTKLKKYTQNQSESLEFLQNENLNVKDNVTSVNGVCNVINKNLNVDLKNNTFDTLSLDSDNTENSLVSYDDLLPLDPSYSISTVVNVLKKLRIPHCSSTVRDLLINFIRHKPIPENQPLVEYLLMRAIENANENDLVNFLSCCGFKLYSRFFSTYPKRDINLLEWLSVWIQKGAVPVVTRNLQKCRILTSENILRNPWKHNVVLKTEASEIYLSNPKQKITDYELESQLCRPSLIFVDRQCIVERWNSKVNLRNLLRANHDRWYNENVLGQVATIIREHEHSSSTVTNFIRIPSNCRCGITLFVPSENLTLCNEINRAVELPMAVC